jgi:hypothetical protein
LELITPLLVVPVPGNKPEPDYKSVEKQVCCCTNENVRFFDFSFQTDVDAGPDNRSDTTSTNTNTDKNYKSVLDHINDYTNVNTTNMNR